MLSRELVSKVLKCKIEHVGHSYFPNTNTYIMAPSGGQAQGTFTKLEDLAKGNIASVIGVSSVFLDECVRMNSTADPFTHAK